MIAQLKQYRDGKTLDEAAKSLGVNKTTLLRWEDGVVQIPADRVIEVERVTGISRHILRPDLSAIFVKRVVLPVTGEAEDEETAA